MALDKSERADWLKTLCNPWNPKAAEVFEASLDGARYIGATNGHAMTLLRAREDEQAKPFDGDGPQKILDGFAAAKWRLLPFVEVTRWAMSSRDRCEACGGLGFLSEPGWVAFDADGSGPEHDLWTRCDCANPGSLAGVIINKRLLLEYMAAMETGQVAVAAFDGKMLALRSPDCIVIAMGLKDTETADVFPEPSNG